MDTRQQRTHEVRERRINAVSEFTKSAHTTIDAIRDAVRGDSAKESPARQGQADEALRRLHSAESQNSLVQLLFADISDPRDRAKKIVNALREANRAMTDDHVTDDEVREKANEADMLLDGFVNAAADVVKTERRHGLRVRGERLR